MHGVVAGNRFHSFGMVRAALVAQGMGLRAGNLVARDVCPTDVAHGKFVVTVDRRPLVPSWRILDPDARIVRNPRRSARLR